MLNNIFKKDNIFKKEFEIVNDVLVKYNGNRKELDLSTGKIPSFSVIGKGAFAGCTTLVNLHIRPHCTIEERAFEGCTSLKEVSGFYHIKSIGRYAFKDCTSLKKIEVATDNNIIPEGAFIGCTSLKSVILRPSSNTRHSIVVNSYAFANCKSLTTIDLSDVKELGEECFAFSGLSGSLTVHENIKEYRGAFIGTQVKEVTVYSNGDGYEAFAGCRELAKINIYVTEIQPYMFMDCKSLTQLDFSATENKITTIYDGAFKGCSNLKYVVFPKTIKYIGSGSFSECTSLTDLYFLKEAKLKTICEYAFAHCKSINNIRYTSDPENYVNIDRTSFPELTIDTYSVFNSTDPDYYDDNDYSDDSFTSINFDGSSESTSTKSHSDSSVRESDEPEVKKPKIKIDNLPANSQREKRKKPTGTSNPALNTNQTSSRAIKRAPEKPTTSNQKQVIEMDGFKMEQSTSKTGAKIVKLVGYEGTSSEVIIPDIVTRIGKGCFKDNWNITKVIIPDKVVSIAEEAFSGCQNLMSVEISKNSRLKTIKDKAFFHCTAMESIRLPKNINEVSDDAFNDCQALKTISIPSTFTYDPVYLPFNATVKVRKPKPQQ